MSMALTYTLASARSTFRNTRFILFTLALPLMMYLIFNGLFRGQTDVASGLSVSAYIMVSMAAYGSLGAAINAGARVAIERQTGWNRQLRLTALSSRGYIFSKTAESMLVALPAILLVFVAGAVVGHVRMPITTWLGTGLGIWLALIPFGVAGLVIGFLASADSVQSLTVLVLISMAILGGLWFPVDQFSAFLQGVAKVLPSYWVGETGRSILGGRAVPLNGLLIMLAWALGLGLFGAWAYRRSGRKT